MQAQQGSTANALATEGGAATLTRRSLVEENRGPIGRPDYRALTEDQKARLVAVKDSGAEFLALCDTLGASRELSIAKTNIEQAVMWAVKGITRPG